MKKRPYKFSCRQGNGRHDNRYWLGGLDLQVILKSQPRFWIPADRLPVAQRRLVHVRRHNASIVVDFERSDNYW